jgi:hypothetical protein
MEEDDDVLKFLSQDERQASVGGPGLQLHILMRFMML